MYVFTIPCRRELRFKQLEYWLRAGVAWIERQSYIDDYRILVIEQVDDFPFNLGWNINVGFSLTDSDNKDINYKYDKEHRFVYQPVDCVPQDSTSLVLGTPHQELVVIPNEAWDKISSFKDYCVENSNEIVCLTPRWWLPDVKCWKEWSDYYKALVMGRAAYECINGHSNEYFGWGVEDDDLLLRMKLMKNEIVEIHRGIIFDELVNVEQDHGSNWPVFYAAKEKKDVCVSGLNDLSYEIIYVKEKFNRIFIVGVSQ